MTITESMQLREFYISLRSSLDRGEVEHALIALETAIEHIELPAQGQSNSLVDQ